MEKIEIKTNNEISVNNFELDLQDINELLKNTDRINVIRQLEEFKNIIANRIIDEKIKIQKNEDNFHEKKENLEVIKYEIISKFAFEDKPTFVKIYITEGFHNLTGDEIITEFQKDALEIRIENHNNKNYKLSINLFSEIIPVDSYYKLQPEGNGILIYLKKAKEENWNDLKNLGKQELSPNDRVIPMNKFLSYYEEGDEDSRKKLKEAFQVDDNLIELIKNRKLNGESEINTELEARSNVIKKSVEEN